MCLIPVQTWGLIGVILGFTLGEGSRWVREKIRIKKLKLAVRTELKAILAQIEDKEDILKQAIQALKQKSVLHTTAVRFITTGYASHIEDLYEHYSDIDRNCLHVIYERLRVADLLTESFFENVQRALKDKILADPWNAYITHLEDLLQSFKVVKTLVSSFLADKSEDVFHIVGQKKGG